MTITWAADLSSSSIARLLDEAASPALFIGDPRVQVECGPRVFERMHQVLEDASAGMAYSDSAGHPRIDYQLGSVRDNFDFGSLIAVSVEKARRVWQGGTSRWGGLYDLRLRLSESHG